MKDRKVKVLVAEDDFFVRKEIKRALSHGNYQVLDEATDGKQAVELTCALRPDVVLMDIKMPVMNGIDATRIIQDKCPTPVVFLTAHESKDMVEQASAAGASAYMTKPPRRSEIDMAITVAMSRHNDVMKLQKLNTELELQKAELEKALDEIKTLQGILPICSYCKNIRDDEGSWERLEKYITERSDAKFSHGICPNCLESNFPEFSAQ